ncbi:MAG: carbohydrate ABC transporter permease [Sphaerochaeta sp.]
MHKKISIGKFITYSLALFWIFATLAPLVLAFLSSFKDNTEIYLRPWQFPASWFPTNYIFAIREISALRSVFNSLFVALATSMLVLIVALLASYPMSRKNLPIIKKFYTVFVVAIMVPVHSTLISISSLASVLNARNQFWYLISVYAAFNLASSIFLVSSYMDNISKEIDDAATIDGCNDIQVLFLILAPMCKPILATQAIFTFVFSYGELIFALTLLSDSKLYTVSRALLSFYGDGDVRLGGLFAFIILSVIPSIIVYIFFHKQILSGATAGAVKG